MICELGVMSRFRSLMGDDSPETLLDLVANYIEWPTHALLDHMEQVQSFCDELPFIDVNVAADIIASKFALILRN